MKCSQKFCFVQQQRDKTTKEDLLHTIYRIKSRCHLQIRESKADFWSVTVGCMHMSAHTHAHAHTLKHTPRGLQTHWNGISSNLDNSDAEVPQTNHLIGWSREKNRCCLKTFCFYLIVRVEIQKWKERKVEKGRQTTTRSQMFSFCQHYTLQINFKVTLFDVADIIYISISQFFTCRNVSYCCSLLMEQREAPIWPIKRWLKKLN